MITLLLQAAPNPNVTILMLVGIFAVVACVAMGNRDDHNNWPPDAI